MQFIVFEMSDEKFGIEITKVDEISKIKESTPLPQSKDYIQGIIDLRNKLVTVIDMRKLLEIKNNNDRINDRMLIVDYNLEQKEGNYVGFLVDKAKEIIDIDGKNIEPGKQNNQIVAKEFIKGVAKHEDDLVLLLDIEQLINII